jgi:hypothetical protein
LLWSPYVTSSMTRACLQLLLILTRAVILRSESRRTHDHILLSQIWDSLNLEGQVPIFISLRNRVARLYSQALGPLSVASYNLRGYGGDIRPRLHTGLLSQPQLNYRSSLYSPSTDHTENIPLTIACSLIAGETTCPQSCFLAMGVVLLPVYTAVTWQWVYMSHYEDTDYAVIFIVLSVPFHYILIFSSAPCIFP